MDSVEKDKGGDKDAIEAWLDGSSSNHEIMEGASTMQSMLHSAAQRGQLDIIRKLLEEKNVDVNEMEPKTGDTALHMAARGGFYVAVQDLVQAGADLGAQNKEGETAMSLMGNIPADILEEILDNSIVGRRDGSNYMMTIRYPFLNSFSQRETSLKSVVSTTKEQEEGTKEEITMKTISPEEKSVKESGPKVLPETVSLLFMTQSKEHRHLLEHPVITSFMHMKWKTIEPFFLVKFACCILYVAFLNAYVFLLNQNIGLKNEGKLEETEAESAIKWITFVLLILLTIRELLQMFEEGKQIIQNIKSTEKVSLASLRKACEPLISHVKERESWLRLGLIISSYLLIFLPWEMTRVKHLSAVSILLSWVYWLFFLANHPMAAVYATMVTTVSKNFCTILVWLFWFVFAFALTFFFLFHSTEKDDEGNIINPSFANVNEAIMKTVVMVFTGEIDFGALVFPAPFGKVIFLLFVFFIMLVLMNILNGMAISDIALIQKESEINTQIRRMLIISAYEAILDKTPFLRNVVGYALISEKLKKKEAVFKLTEREWTRVSPENCDFVPAAMLDTAKELAVNKSLVMAQAAEIENPAIKELKDRLKNIELTLEKMTEKLTKLTK